MPVISVLEQQTSGTLADAASRLQTKDAKIKAASLEIASLEKELAESLLKESKLTADLIKEQDTGREANARYAKLESSCEAQLKALKAKDTLIGTAEDHAKKLDVNRLKELEKAGATLSSMKSNHQSEVEAFRAELSALRGQMNVQHKDHEKEMEGARQRMQKSHEELLSENEFNHIADKTNQLNALRTELEASYTVVREKDAIYLLDFKDKHAADVTKLRLTYEKETKAALAAQKEELNGEIARTRIEADRIKEAALQSSIEETSKRRDEELIRFRENSSVQSEEMMASAKRELEKSLEGQRKELMAARDILLADRKYEEQSTLAALVETHTTLLNAVKVQSEKDMKELQRILEAESFRSDSLQRELADRQIALQSLHFNMEASDEAVRIESEAALTALKAQQKAEIKNLQSTMKGRLVEEQAAIASVRQLLELESLERIASDNRLAQLENQLAESVKTHDIEIIDTRATLNSKMAELESQSVKNKQTHANEMADLKASSESLISELEGRIASGRSDANSVSAERDDLERRIAEMEITAKKDKVIREELIAATTASDLRVNEYSCQLQAEKAYSKAVSADNAALDLKLAELERLILEGRADYENQSERIFASESKLIKMEEQARIDKVAFDDLMVEKLAVKRHMGHLESADADKAEQLKDLSAYKASSESLISELEGRIASGRSDANSVSAERDDLERRIAEMEITAKKDKKAYTADIAEAKAASDVRMAELDNKLVAALKEKRLSQDRVDNLLSQVKTGQAHTEEQKLAIDALHSRIADLECLISDDKMNTNEVMKAKNSLESLVAELEGQVKRDYKTYELEMVRARAVMDGTVSDLERQLAEEKERHTTELVKAKVASDNHLVEIKCEMNNTVKALEGSARLQLDALRCELLKEEAARQAVKIKEIVRFKDLERAAALATSEEGKAAKVATLEKDHCVALNDLRDELSEQHSRQLTQALSALHDRKELDIQAAVSAAKSEVDSELQCSSRHLVETLGQEGRDALEIQRAMLDAVRVADREKASKEIQALSFRHEEVLSAVSVEHSRALQRALEEQRGELRKAFDLLVAKKERASEIAQEDAKAIHLLERDQLLAAQRVQHVRTDNHSPA